MDFGVTMSHSLGREETFDDAGRGMYDISMDGVERLNDITQRC